jgi:hypothetical protein
MIDPTTLILLERAERLLGTAQTHIDPNAPAAIAAWAEMSNLRRDIRNAVGPDIIAAVRELEDAVQLAKSQ